MLCQGCVLWLTVPFTRVFGRSTHIRDVDGFAPHQTERRMTQSLWHAFAKAPHWADVAALLNTVASQLHATSLRDLCVAATTQLLEMAGSLPEVRYASSMRTRGHGSELLSSICRELGAAEYISGSGGKTYLNLHDFRTTSVLWQQW